jgi:endoglucanase
MRGRPAIAPRPESTCLMKRARPVPHDHLGRLLLLVLPLMVWGLVGPVPAASAHGVVAMDDVDVSPTPDQPDAEPTAVVAGDRGPFDGRELYVDPSSSARRAAADARAQGEEAMAVGFDRVGDHAQADWFGDWNPTSKVRATVDRRMNTIADAGAYPVFVLYAIPGRDCGSYSGGGFNSAETYLAWVREVAAGIGGRPAAVVLEPDSLALLDCLSTQKRAERLAMLRDAVDELTGSGPVAVYLDGGHSMWHSAGVMANRLRDGGVAAARGFALNVSNFRWTDDEVAYARDLSDRLGGKHAVIDTSRNGRGPTEDHAWCNPAGRGLGPSPTTSPTETHVDALLWLKRPGESDGECGRGEPAAGVWWPEYALELAFVEATDELLDLPSGYVPLTPTRLLDTRVGLGSFEAPLGREESRSVRVTGVGGVPSEGVGAVVVNVAVTGATRNSFVTVWPAGVERPLASTLNVTAGQTLANEVIAKVGDDGMVEVYNHRGEGELIFDVVGYLPAD